jgi:AcrR family transcriptional regulator
MNTKDAIIDKARELFNAEGTARVSTNHIAAALGISPGNLYYHYRNKTEIVRALFARFEAESDSVWQDALVTSVGELEVVLERHFAACAPFEFLGRELAPLTLGDPELRESVTQFLRRLEAQVRAALGSLAHGGEIEPSHRVAFLSRIVASLLVLWPAHDTVGRRHDAPARGLRPLVAGS